MGVVEGIGFADFPAQGPLLGRRVRVCFRYNTANQLLGTVVRDDAEGPMVTIIRLDDGRHVLDTECQHSLPIDGR